LRFAVTVVATASGQLKKDSGAFTTTAVVPVIGSVGCDFRRFAGFTLKKIKEALN
jgi:hypothetical protein